MRKIILAALAATVALPAVATPAMAQSRHELRRDRQDIREERREYRQALRYGSPRDIRAAHASGGRTPTLEDVFVELVQGDARPPGAL